MSAHGYKKYMKQNAEKDYSLIKLFTISFIGMLFVFTILIKSFSPSVDVSIGDYKQDNESIEDMQNIDGRLSAIQDEDQGRSFSELMQKAEDIQRETADVKDVKTEPAQQQTNNTAAAVPASDPVYKVFVGSYSSAEQAKVAKDIIIESGSNLNPIVKCIGSNNYTLQVGIFKSKAGAETQLAIVQQNHLPGRIVQEY